MARQPFVGWSGKELFSILTEAFPEVLPGLATRLRGMFNNDSAWIGPRKEWLEAAGISFTNVFNFRPERNSIGAICCDIPTPGWPRLGQKNAQNFPNGAFLQEKYFSELERLKEEIKQSKPNLIVACGNTACWAVLKATNISSIRGSIALGEPPLASGIKILPTYHPAGVLRNWSWRPIVVADFLKSKREGEFPELKRPRRGIVISPTLGEARAWIQDTLSKPERYDLLSVDIETVKKQISCIGFARSKDSALVVPFIAPPGKDYWETLEDEISAWKIVRDLLENPIPKVFQNGMYDLQYIFKMGIRTKNCLHDTMLLHHSIYPELLKGLGFLGSIYTNEASWKLMNRPKADTEKRDE